MTACLAAALLASACAAKVQLTYEPTNEVSGTGPLGIRGFAYLPAEQGLVKEDQSQVVGAPLKGETYTETVADFFARALQLELQKSGFQLSGVAERNVTGRIEAFGLDHSPKANRIDAIVQVSFVILKSGQTEFEYLSSATKEYRSVIRGKTPREMMTELTQQCIASFLTEARAQNHL